MFEDEQVLMLDDACKYRDSIREGAIPCLKGTLAGELDDVLREEIVELIHKSLAAYEIGKAIRERFGLPPKRD
jgi:hypothetical protein